LLLLFFAFRTFDHLFVVVSFIVVVTVNVVIDVVTAAALFGR
jgi:hypothetical protein